MGLPEQNTSNTYGLGYRHVMATLALLLGFVMSVFQAGITVGIVSMTSKNSSNTDFEEFDWPSTGKNAILSSYFWGSLLGSLPAGYLGQKLNVKFLIMGGTLVDSVLASLTPTVARAGGWQGYCVLASLQGFVASLFAPGMYILVSRWAPRIESTTLLGLANLGAPLGTAIALPVCGLLAKGPFGWPSIFYFGTLVSLLWTTIFFIFGSQSPSETGSFQRRKGIHHREPEQDSSTKGTSDPLGQAAHF
uniref:Putative inorganic phosphate cotransporter n=1 Tax=Lygus hesperus TaxID=30085 RepID=A0A0A9XR83_LYGHE